MSVTSSAPPAPPAPRFVLETTFDGVRTVIPARRHWGLVLFLGLWLCGWAVGEALALGTILSSFSALDEAIPALFLLVWLLGWTAGGAFTLTILLWNLIGRETIAVERGALTVTRQIGPLPLRRTYDVAHVRNLRVAPPMRQTSRHQGPFAGGTIAFDYGTRTHRFGHALDDPEAQYLLDLLQPYLPRAA